MMEQKKKNSSRALLMVIFAIPAIIGLFFFFNWKKISSERQATECQESCAKEGFSGNDFKWNVFGRPNCKCLQGLNKSSRS